MPAFATKALPSADKLRGGYYTPESIARFVAAWVAEAGKRMLEPSCGDGAILRWLASANTEAVGVELVDTEARKARQIDHAQVVHSDFFAWFTAAQHNAWDGVAGNPPYIRFGSWGEDSRELAFRLMRAEGLAPTRLTNAWVPFVVASLVAVRPGGRVGLVVPAELLQVGYAAPLRSYLVDHCADITIVSFRGLVFAGILQEVVLLLATKGEGPATIRTIEVADADDLTTIDTNGTAARAHLHESEKWTKYYLSPDAIELIRRARTDGRLSPLGAYAAVNVGVVTGRNSFFTLTDEEADARRLLPYTVPLLSRSAQIRGVTFAAEDLAEDHRSPLRTRLIAVPPDLDLTKHPDLAAYIALGEEHGVPDGYKCSIRSPWWSVPSVTIPDGFMLRQVANHVRLTTNDVTATSTDTVHRVFLRPGFTMPKVATAALNSATLALSEVLGRSYGGGLLEMEPSECQTLPIPDPQHVPDGLPEKVDELLRSGRLDDALRIVDELVLVDGAGFTESEVAALRSAWTYMRERRAARARGSKPA